MNKAIAVVLLAGLAASAHGRAIPGLHLSFSQDGGATWKTDVLAAPGDTIIAQVEMTIPDSFYGIAGARYNIVCTNGGWDSGGDDLIDLSAAKGFATDGRMADFDFGGQTQLAYEAAHSLRIDVADDPNDNPIGGISTCQQDPLHLGTAFNTSKAAPVYRFIVKLSGVAGSRILTLRIPDGGANGSINQITSFMGYASASDLVPVDIPIPVGDTGTITIIPAPAGAWGIILSLFTSRRRRAWPPGVIST